MAKTIDDHAVQIAHNTSLAVLRRAKTGQLASGMEPAGDVGDAVGFIELLIPLIPIFLQLLASVFSTNCAKTTPGATPQSYLKTKLDPDQQDFSAGSDAFVQSHRPNARRAIRINNRGKAPRDRVRPGEVSDDNLDEMIRQSFNQVLSQSPSAALSGYNQALAASQSLDMDA